MRCGVIANAYFNQPDGWYYVDGIIWDDKAISLINDGWSVSCSYDFLAFNDEGGEENNIHYDKEFTQLNFTHLAIVNNPRYERANIVFNCKVENDRWITIHPNGEDEKGRHLLLKDGESPKEAIDRVYKKEEQKQPDTKDGGESILDTIERRNQQAKDLKEKGVLKDIKKPKTFEERQQEDIDKGELVELGKFPTKFTSEYEEYKPKDKQSDTKDGEYADRGQIEEHLKEKYGYKDFLAKDKEDDKKEEKKARTFVDKSGKEHSLKDLVEKGYNPVRYGSSLWENKPSYGIGDGKTEYKISEDEYKEALEHKKNKKSADLQKAKEKSKDLTDYIKWQYNADIEPHITRRVGDKTLVDWDKLPRETQSALKRLDFDGKIKLEEYSGFEKSIDVTDKKIFKNLDKHKANNSKEIEMYLIDKLQELINSVKNNKENETMVENEKVDKRKLIDEVAGIMKSAGCDDEDIRTAIGKMEKIGYDDSEASADNKKVKNEADEEDKKVDNEEDKKEEDKKVDNEEDKDEDKKEEKVDNESEEDKEKVEDLKKEEKKDIDNKCKNSKEESYFDKLNKIYNSAKKIESASVDYEDKQTRLDAGKEYFG